MDIYWTPLSSGFCALCKVVSDGVRVLMVDFGFAGFLDKFEERFGKAATTVLLFSIGLAVISVCLSTFYIQAVVPVYSAIIRIWESHTFNFEGYWDLTRSFIILVLVVLCVQNAVQAFRNLIRLKEIFKGGRKIVALEKQLEDQITRLNAKSNQLTDALEELKVKHSPVLTPQPLAPQGPPERA